MTDAAIQRVAAKSRPKAPWQVWRDAAGRLSPLRIAVLAFLFVPVAVVLCVCVLNADPVNVGCDTVPAGVNV